MTNIKDLCHFFQFLPHGRPSLLFSNYNEKYQTKYQVNPENPNQWETIDSVYIFRDGISPKWEDEKNAEGCEYIQSMAQVEPNQIDSMWFRVIVSLVSEDFPFSKDQVNGIKICEKIVNQNQFIRIDLWIKKDINKEDEESINQH